MPSALELQSIRGADSHKGRQRPWKNALIRIWAAFSPDVHLSMEEGWGGGEKGFKLIFTTRKELVIHTIWGATSLEPPLLPQPGVLGARLGPSSPVPLSPLLKHPVSPNPFHMCFFFHCEQNKLQFLLQHQISFIIPPPPYSRPRYLLPSPSKIHMWGLFNPSKLPAGLRWGLCVERRDEAVY